MAMPYFVSGISVCPCEPYADLVQRREYHFWLYILASRSRNLYTGVTNDLIRRVAQHRELMPGSFTGRYNIDRLVYFEYFRYVRSAIGREKEVKRWTRAERIALIEKVNPTWEDLFPGLLRTGEGALSKFADGESQTADPLRG